jgi:GDP-mannose 6-dehydrogenase
MRISVFGLGYVGTVSAACFADAGHEVTGVDPAAKKVALINAGEAPIVEAGLAEIVARNVASGRLRATDSAADAIAASDISYVCVGTPSRANGDLDVSAIRAVCLEIGREIARKSTRHTIVIRSTVLPGTMHDVSIPALEEASGMKALSDFGVASNPEFLREATAIFDFYNPPKTVIGANDPATAAQVAQVYSGLPGPMIDTSIEIAEMVKYVDNVWHATKVAFANEIGNICKAVGVDSHAVMDIFCQDTKLNISTYYMKPGFAFGGSCLPKDVRALGARARALEVDVPLIHSLLPSNREQVERAMRMVVARGKRRIGVLGFAFKSGTDDMRESPVLELIERLHGKGYELRIFDPSVELSRLMGANLDYLAKGIPHIERMMVDSIAAITEFADLVIIGNNAAMFHDVAGKLRPDQEILDLVRIPQAGAAHPGYEGVNW